MSEGIAVFIAAVCALIAQAAVMAVEARRRRYETSSSRRASARLIRDEVSGCLEAVHQAVVLGRWWTEEYDLDSTTTVEDRRQLAAVADPETLRRSFGSLRRYRQLQVLRRRGSLEDDVNLTYDQMVEVVAVFLDLALARWLLADETGYKTVPFARPVAISDELLSAASAAVAIDNPRQLFVDPTRASDV